MKTSIELTPKNIRLVRIIKENLNNKILNLQLLEELLTILEGKIEPAPANGKPPKRNLKNQRIAYHLANILGAKGKRRG